MSRIEFTLNKAGVRALLKSDMMQGLCQEKGNQYAAEAGDGYVAEARHYPKRYGVSVYPGNGKAAIDNITNNTLEKVYHND